LGAAPVGGIKDSTLVDTSSLTDRVLVRLPDLPSARQVQLGTVAIPRTDSGTSAGDSSAAWPSPKSDTTSSAVAKPFQRTQGTSTTSVGHPPGKLTALLTQGLRQIMNSSYASALDAFFGMAQWLEETGLQAPTAPSFPEDLPTLDESADFEGRGTTLLPESAQLPSVPDRVLVNGLAALATLAVARLEKKQKSEIRGQRSRIRDQKPEVRC